MDKLEKVIKGLKYLHDVMRWSPDESEESITARRNITGDALALLKAQEPMEPTLDIRHGKSMWRCGSCSTALQPNQMHAKFCFNCGKAVKWE